MKLCDNVILFILEMLEILDVYTIAIINKRYAELKNKYLKIHRIFDTGNITIDDLVQFKKNTTFKILRHNSIHYKEDMSCIFTITDINTWICNENHTTCTGTKLRYEWCAAKKGIILEFKKSFIQSNCNYYMYIAYPGFDQSKTRFIFWC